jgi:hypothetical protein
MAVSTIETIVANPARKRKHMAKRMTLKQKLHFGSARQRTAAKAALRGARKRKRTARRNTSRPRHRRRTQNPGEIIAMTLGNPARRKTVAKAKARKRRSTSKAHHAGHRRRRRHVVANPARRHHRRRHVVNRGHRRRQHNPAGFGWGGVVELGVGAVVGSSGSSALTQLVLGTSNTGAMGYGVNFLTTLVLSWVGSMGPLRKFKGFAPGILAGGIGSLIRRVIADYSLLGGYTAQLGMGDYMVSNWVAPQRLISDFRSLTDAGLGQGQWGLQPANTLSAITGAAPMSSSGVSTRGLGLEGDPGTYGSVGY